MARRSTKTPPPDDSYEEKILDIDVVDEMQGSFLEYAYSVIYSRALPDARDGLKPVHRRIVYQMNEMGLRPDRGYVKCARVVGEVMGKLHPHGDASIYDALVRMAQPFSMRVPLVDGHGNFGSLGNDDPPAAMRYTECRQAQATSLMTESIDEDTVDFTPNYDGQEQEPVALPAAFPNLLVNGSSGIAVGMATNMPPHNLAEVIAAARHLIRFPNADLDTLMKFVPGPDLPTGGRIVGLAGIRDAYESGRGTFKIRATVEVETVTARRKGLVITELPFAVGPEKVIAKIKDLVGAKKIQGIADVKDLTDRAHGLRLVIEIKNGFVPEAVLEQLYKLTPMEESFGINNVALVDGQPLTLGLKEAPGGLPRPPLRGRTTAQRVPPHQAARPSAPGGGPADRPRRHRRGHPADPLQRELRAGQGAPDGALLPVGDPDPVHSGHPAAPPHQVRPDRAGVGEGAAERGDRGADPDPRVGRGAAQAGLHRTGRGGQEVRQRAAHCPVGGVGRPGGRCTAAGRGRPVPDPALLDGPAGPHVERRALPGGRRRPAREARRDRLRGPGHGTRRDRRGDLLRPPAADQRRRPPAAPGHGVGAEPRGRGTPVGVRLPGGRRDGGLPDHARRVLPGLALGTEQGIVKRVVPDYPSNKDELEVITLRDGDRIVGAIELRTGEEDLVFITDDAQLLRYQASQVRPQGRPAGGMAGVKLTDGAKVISFTAVDPAADAVVFTVAGSRGTLDDSVQTTAKLTPFDQYPRKGRATGGVRCQRFLKGEDCLSLAWAGAVPAKAAQKNGTPADLPEIDPRRDGSGVSLAKTVAVVAGPV